MDRDAIHSKAGGVSDVLGAVLYTCTTPVCFILSWCIGPLFLGPECFRSLGTSVQPPQLHVRARHVDRQLFLHCYGEVAMLAVPLGLLRLLCFGWSCQIRSYSVESHASASCESSSPVKVELKY